MTSDELLRKKRRYLRRFDLSENGSIVRAANGAKTVLTYDGGCRITEKLAKAKGYERCVKCGRAYLPFGQTSGLCPSCVFSGGKTFCTSCGNPYDGDQTAVSTLCPSCVAKMQSGIEKYHASRSRPYTFFGHDGDGEFVGVGFELEVDCFAPIDRTEFRKAIVEAFNRNLPSQRASLENDRSLLCGAEIVSAPHTLPAMKEFVLGPMAAFLADLTSRTPAENDSPLAGLHVHVSKAALGKSDYEIALNLAKLTYFANKNADWLMRFGRRMSFRKLDFGKPDWTFEDAQNAVRSPQTRYVAVNVLNPSTVEFRFMQTTTDVATLLASVEFCYALCVAANSVPVERSGELAPWLAELPPEVEQYIDKLNLKRA